MKRKNKDYRFLKNRTWKSKYSHRLKGHPAEVCQDYLSGQIDYAVDHIKDPFPKGSNRKGLAPS